MGSSEGRAEGGAQPVFHSCFLSAVNSLQRAGPESLDCPDEPHLGPPPRALGSGAPFKPNAEPSFPFHAVPPQCRACSIPVLVPGAGAGNNFFVRRTLTVSQL